MDELADEFVASGWDLRQLTRWMLLSDPFTRSQVITEANARDVPHDGAMPLFSRMYYRPASFSDPIHALAQLIQTPGKVSAETSRERPRDTVAARVASSLDAEGHEAEEWTRVLSSLTATGQQLTVGQRQLIETWAASRLPPEQIVQHVFRCVLGRAPRGDEIQLAQRFCHSMKDDRRQGVESLVWALVNTQEFVRDH